MTTYITKTAYLAFVASWKQDYAELSVQIRETKQGRKSCSDDERGILNRRREQLRDLAREMLETRAEMKEVAQASYLKDRSEATDER